jgi:metallophosphoesterase (TIGR00282 family)
MRVLFVGDVVGSPGLELLKKGLASLKRDEALDLIIVNAENASHGSGLTPRDYRHVRAAGADVVTLGDHIYKKQEITDILAAGTEPICKPANFPRSAPGRDFILVEKAGVTVAVISLLGRTYMRPVDCPYEAVDRVLAEIGTQARVILIDIHAEATADKYLLLHHVKGRVSAVFGTHTHVQTADEQILPEGTAFLCDAGMTGPYESVLGRRVDRVLRTATTFLPSSFDVATGDVRLAGVIVDIEESTGKATAIRRVMLREADVRKSAD